MNCGVSIQWNVIPPEKGRNTCHSLDDSQQLVPSEMSQTERAMPHGSSNTGRQEPKVVSVSKEGRLFCLMDLIDAEFQVLHSERCPAKDNGNGE